MTPSIQTAPERTLFDAIVVGGSTAGLSAALLLGRARRNVLVCDAGQPRNAPAEHVYGFYSRDAISPSELKALGRRQLEPYPTVRTVDVAVTEVLRKPDDVFVATLADGSEHAAAYLLLATGLRDVLPSIDGLPELWGSSVFVCPYCDAWEVRDQPVAAYGKGRAGFLLAQLLLSWTSDIAVCSDGPAALTEDDCRWLQTRRIPLVETPITRFAARDGQLSAIVFSDGTRLPRSAAFLRVPLVQASTFPEALGCDIDPDGAIVTDETGQTSVSGCYAAGDAASHVHQVALAVASGTRAAIGINVALSLSSA